MTLKSKKKFFKKNWFWCLLHGFDKYHLNRFNGNFMRHTKKCEVKG